MSFPASGADLAEIDRIITASLAQVRLAKERQRMTYKRPYINLVRGLSLLWHYRIIAGNGEVIASSETYFSRSNADRAAEKAARDLGLEIR